MTYDEFTQQLKQNRERCERISNSINSRARKLCHEAGLEVCCLHNALVGLHYGQPWPNVDYAKAKKAQWLFNKQFEASRIADRWYTDHYRDVKWEN